MKILITGAKGFIGTNLSHFLEHAGHTVLPFDLGDDEQTLTEYIKASDFIIHLAGINRPLDKKEFYDGNVNFTAKLIDLLHQTKTHSPILFSSSTQAALDNDYGKSKRMAEELFLEESNQRPVYIFRLYNVYGKGCRPNYNSVIATWCSAIASNQPISFNENDPAIDFVYIDDVIASFLKAIEGKLPATRDYTDIIYPEPHDKKRLSEIRKLLFSFRDSRTDLNVALQEGFSKKLYATYLSYLPKDSFAYPLNMHIDQRGSFTECLHFPSYGQVSVNISHPGITKGNHYHETKNEKFLCVSGSVIIRFRKVGTKEIISYECSENELKAVDIPPGYTHSIETVGEKDSVTLMWANEPYDPAHPDTYFEPVIA